MTGTGARRRTKHGTLTRSRRLSRPHNLKVTYNWMIPGLSKHMGDNAIVKGVFDGWQLSGISTFLGGSLWNFTYNFSGAAPNVTTLTGGLGGSRVIIVCDPNLPRSERTFDRQYKPSACARPGPSRTGRHALSGHRGWRRAGRCPIGPRLHQPRHDPAEELQFGGGRILQGRAEAYNVFNATQITGVNTVATFDFATGVQTNPRSAQSARARANSNRVIQLGVRLTF